MSSDGLAGATVSEISGPLTGPALLRALDGIGAHPALIECAGTGEEPGRIWVNSRKLADVQFGWRTGMPALLRLLTWYDGHFIVHEGPHDHNDVLANSAADAFKWAADTAKQWRRSVAAIGGLEVIFEVNFATLAMRLGDIPDAANGVLRLIDGQRCLRVLLDAVPGGEMETLALIEQLTRDGILRPVESASAPSWVQPAPAAPVPAIEITPASEEAIGLIPIEAIPLPPMLPQDAGDEAADWAGEVTAPARTIPVHRFPLEQGGRRRRIARQAAGVLEKLAQKKERATPLTREVITPGAIIPPDLTEKMLLESLEDVAPAEPLPPRPTPRLDEAFEQFFSRQQRRRRFFVGAAVLAVAGTSVALVRSHSLRKPAPPPAPVGPPQVTMAPVKKAPPPAEPTFDELMAGGIKARDQKQPDKAIELLQKAVSVHKTAVSEEELGRTYYTAGRLAPAIDALKDATSLDPKSADAFMYLGMALQDANRIPEAKKAYYQYLRLGSTRSKQYAEIAAVVKNLGKH